MLYENNPKRHKNITDDLPKKKKKKQNAWKKYECLVKFRITTKFIRTCIGSKTY